MNILENEIYDNDTCSDIEETTGYFEGIVDVYDETFYVNTLTNVGLESVLKKVEPLINKMCSKTYISGYAFEDIKQELNIMVIQGISKYDPAKGTKLSTFLQNHLRKKMISKLRSVNKMSNHALRIT
jgi:DNA-directed RNA polymerase specialized sigma subunit